MENRALVIKTYGNPERCGAIVDGITRTVIPLNNKELDAIKKDYKRMKAREGVRHTKAADKKWEDTKRDLAIQYRVKQHGRIYNTLLAGYALTCLIITEWFARLFAAVEGKSYTKGW